MTQETPQPPDPERGLEYFQQIDAYLTQNQKELGIQRIGTDSEGLGIWQKTYKNN